MIPTKTVLNTKDSHSPKKYNIFLIALLVFHLAFYFLFRYLNTAHQTWDSAGHMGLSIKFAELIKGLFNGSSVSLYEILTTSFYYPPLLHVSTALFMLIFGYSFGLQLLLIFALFLFSIYMLRQLVLEVGYSPRIAFLTALFYSLTPIIFDQARLFHMEIPMLLVIMLCSLFLLRCNYFESRKYTLLFFLTLGFGMLLKWYIPIYLAVPFLYILYTAFFVKKRFHAVLPNLFVGSGVFFVICLPWYLANLRIMRLVMSWTSTGESDDPQVLLSVQNIVYYIRNMVAGLNFFVPVVGASLGFITFVRKNKKQGILLLAYLCSVYALFTFIENKNGRYIIGLNIPLAFLLGYYLDRVQKKAITLFVLGAHLLAFFYTSFNHVSPYSVTSRFWGKLLTGPFYDNLYVYPQLYTYRTARDSSEELLDFIAHDAQKKNVEQIGVASLIDQEYLSVATLELLRAKMGHTNMYFTTPYYKKSTFDSDYSLIKYLRDRDTSYIIVPQDPGPENLRNHHVLEQGIDFMNREGSIWFDPIKTYTLLDDNSVTVYRRREFNTIFPIDWCMNFSELLSNEVGLLVDPLASVIVFTGNYSYQDVRQFYVPGTLRVLEINNTSLEPLEVKVGDLPVSGVSVCHRMGTQIKLKKEIVAALDPDQAACGDIPCEKLVHTKVSVDSLKETVHNSDAYFGSGVIGTLRRFKIFPRYEEDYSTEKDIINEFERR
jgi:4-amino-4-deoxy-L-arabinose transferase-like glycosyltransferase